MSDRLEYTERELANWNVIAGWSDEEREEYESMAKDAASRAASLMGVDNYTLIEDLAEYALNETIPDSLRSWDKVPEDERASLKGYIVSSCRTSLKCKLAEMLSPRIGGEEQGRAVDYLPYDSTIDDCEHTKSFRTEERIAEKDRAADDPLITSLMLYQEGDKRYQRALPVKLAKAEQIDPVTGEGLHHYFNLNGEPVTVSSTGMKNILETAAWCDANAEAWDDDLFIDYIAHRITKADIADKVMSDDEQRVTRRTVGKRHAEIERRTDEYMDEHEEEIRMMYDKCDDDGVPPPKVRPDPDSPDKDQLDTQCPEDQPDAPRVDKIK